MFDGRTYLASVVTLSEERALRFQVVAVPVTAIVINNSVQIDLGDESASDVVRNDCIVVGNRVVANNSSSSTPELVAPAHL